MTIVTWYATERERDINSPTLRCLNQQAKATCTLGPVIGWTKKGNAGHSSSLSGGNRGRRKGQMIGQTL